MSNTALFHRPRRTRQQKWIRDLVAETALSPSDLIWPIFVRDGIDAPEPIATLPGVARLSVDDAVMAAKDAHRLGIPVVALFPYTEAHLRTPDAKEALNPDNLVCRATRAIKDAVPEIGVMLDVALDPYNSDGHDGILDNGVILNDETVDILVAQSLVQAAAGADILGPSDMMDGRIAAIRTALEEDGYANTMVMSYSAKFASGYYGPFRDAVGASGYLKGDKKTYQLDNRNSDEALRMIARDIDEGADMVMVKPGMPYLDICAHAANQFDVPVFAYQVSGEYAMIENAIRAGIFDEMSIIQESIMSFKRAGCSGVLTYFAPRLAKILAD